MTLKYAEGTAIRISRMQEDEGNNGTRYAPAGSVGFIEQVHEDINPENPYSVVFQPSGVWGFWNDAEIEGEEVLPPGHPDIPSDAVIALADRVRDLVDDFNKDDDAQLITGISPDFPARLAAAAKGTDAEALVREAFPNAEAVPVPYELYDRIARAAGVGDILGDNPEPIQNSRPTP